MRHGVSGRRLSRSSSHRRALATAQATALIREGRIETTLAKAKELRPLRGEPHHHRQRWQPAQHSHGWQRHS